MRRLAVAATSACGLVLLIAANAEHGRAPAAGAATSPDPELLALGRKVYNFRCYFCHGYSGDAKTLAATFLKPAPRDFTNGPELTRADIESTVRSGRDGTAMKPFAGTLRDDELRAVAAFVEAEFVQRKARNTAYHTAENGWPGHDRHAVAFGFATGAIPLDRPVDLLSAEQQQGRALFLSSCVSCHDRGRVADEGPAWSARPVSYPRMGFVPGQAGAVPVDAVTGASVYARHDVPPQVTGLTAGERRGERLFQANCAFCHGADGTGKNWIGQFMEPKARDLTAYTTKTMPPVLLRRRIRDGLPGTSMPGWGSVFSEGEIAAVQGYVTRVMMRREEMGDQSTYTDAAPKDATVKQPARPSDKG